VREARSGGGAAPERSTRKGGGQSGERSGQYDRGGVIAGGERALNFGVLVTEGRSGD